MIRFARFGLVLALTVVLAGCGGDDKKPPAKGKQGAGANGNGGKQANGQANGNGQQDKPGQPGKKGERPKGQAKTPDGEPGKKSPDTAVAQGSPESVFRAFQDAVGEEKWVEAFVFLTPESQDIMIGQAVFAASVSTLGDPEKSKEVQSLAKQYNIDLESAKKPKTTDPVETMQQLAARVENKPAAFAALVGWMEKNPPEGEQQAESIAQSIRKSKLTSQPNVEGDRATATLSTPQREKDQPIAFLRKDGKWYVDLAESVRMEMEARPRPQRDAPKKDRKKESDLDRPKPREDETDKPPQPRPEGAKKKGAPKPGTTEKP